MWLAKAAPSPLTLNQSVAFKTDELCSHRIIRELQIRREFADGASFCTKQRENLTSRTLEHSLTPTLRFHINYLVWRLRQNTYCLIVAAHFPSNWYFAPK